MSVSLLFQVSIDIIALSRGSSSCRTAGKRKVEHFWFCLVLFPTRRNAFKTNLRGIRVATLTSDGILCQDWSENSDPTCALSPSKIMHFLYGAEIVMRAFNDSFHNSCCGKCSTCFRSLPLFLSLIIMALCNFLFSSSCSAHKIYNQKKLMIHNTLIHHIILFRSRYIHCSFWDFRVQHGLFAPFACSASCNSMSQVRDALLFRSCISQQEGAC